jgi:hypothetical protein
MILNGSKPGLEFDINAGPVRTCIQTWVVDDCHDLGEKTPCSFVPMLRTWARVPTPKPCLMLEHFFSSQVICFAQHFTILVAENGLISAKKTHIGFVFEGDVLSPIANVTFSSVIDLRMYPRRLSSHSRVQTTGPFNSRDKRALTEDCNLSMYSCLASSIPSTIAKSANCRQSLKWPIMKSTFDVLRDWQIVVIKRTCPPLHGDSGCGL